MSLETNIKNLATRVATEIKVLRTSQGDLSTLTTAAKASLVAAINELQLEVNQAVAGSGNASIDDANTSGAATWSSQKITDTVAAAVQSILGGTPAAAYDTLTEIAAAMAADDTQAADLLTAIGNRVRFDAAQTLTTQQKAQARENIGAISAADITFGAATDAAAGLIEIATPTEVAAGVDATRAVTPAGLKTVTDLLSPSGHTHTELSQATDVARGTVELATIAEANTGTDTVRVITPAVLRAITGDPSADFVATFEAGLA